MAIYLVTGAAAFIASKVAEFLLADGHVVMGGDNLNHAYDVRLKHWCLAQLQSKPGFEFHQFDRCDRRGLRELFELQATSRKSPFEAVINLPARAGVRQSVQNPWIYFETNVSGTLNLLELCREYGVRRFILASASSLYGAPNPLPFREDASTNGLLSSYAKSKKATEALCYTYHYLYGLDIVVLRYFTVYGQAGRPDMSLFRFFQWFSEGRPVNVYGDGLQSRDFAHVADSARGTLATLSFLQSATRNSWFEIINLGSDQSIVLMDAIRLVEELVGRKVTLEYRPRHPSDVTDTWADIGKADRQLGWRPQTPFEVGVARLVEGYQETPRGGERSPRAKGRSPGWRCSREPVRNTVCTGRFNLCLVMVLFGLLLWRADAALSGRLNNLAGLILTREKLAYGKTAISPECQDWQSEVGDWPAAIAAYERFLEWQPGDPDVQQRLEEVRQTCE